MDVNRNQEWSEALFRLICVYTAICLFAGFERSGDAFLNSSNKSGIQVDDLVDRFVGMQIAADRSGALALINQALASGIPVPGVMLDVIQPAQYELGRRWECDEISIADEHVGTAIAYLAINRLYEVLPRTEPREQRLVVACVEGEQHDLGARMIADLCEMHGFEVIYLGANVPTESLLRLIDDRRPDATLLSATMTWNLPELERTANRIEAMSVPVVAGGRALSWVGDNVGHLDLYAPRESPLDLLSRLGNELDHARQ